jgi:hypothetical protein
MDLSVYIAELLNENGTISIPKIGVFKQVRMRGYYNADEGKLYPPYFQTEFTQQPIEDDSLLQYLTSKSKVSASSARYFMDKYLQNILQQAEIGEVMLGKLGWLSKEGEALSFRPSTAADTATAAFGFEPVSIKPEAATAAPVEEVAAPAATQSAPLIEEPLQPTVQQPIEPAPVTAPLYSVEKDGLVQKSSFEGGPVTANSPLLRQHLKADNQQTATPAPAPVAGSKPAIPALVQQPAETVPPVPVVEEPVKPFYLKPWFYGIIVAVAAVAAFLYFYQNTAQQEKPSVVAKDTAPSPSMDSVVIKTPTVTQPAVKDTAAQPKAKAESVVTAGNKPMPASTEFAPEVETPAATTPVLVNTNNYKFVLMSGAFGNQEAANQVVARYKAIGVPAAILKNVSRSKYVKVTLGFFKTYAEGQAAKVRLVKLKHLRSSDLYVETLRTKKK